MGQRFFVESPVTGESAILTGPEARHLSKVMRARVGDDVTLFDGGGCEFTARVDRIERSSVQLQIVARREIDRELPFDLTLGVALPKGERQRWLVEKLTELGVTRLVPVVTSRGVAQPEPNTVVRMRRSVVEASKQCGRNRLMDIAQPLAFADFIHSGPDAALRLLVHPISPADHISPTDRIGEQSRLPEKLASRHRGTTPIIIAVGPEGGFDDQEITLAAQREWQFVDLGPRILRVETAAVGVAALFSMEAGRTQGTKGT